MFIIWVDCVTTKKLHRKVGKKEKKALKWCMLYLPLEMHSSATDEPLEQTCTTGKHFYGTEVMKSF